MSDSYLFTSESVTEGHPDKVSDQISDAVLDAVLEQDPTARVACETLVNTGLAMLAGEITTTAKVDFSTVVRDTIREIGYNSGEYGFDADSCSVMNGLDRQSPDIAMGVDVGGAGDQGLMFGYACDETEELMPLSITLAHQLVERMAKLRKDGTLGWLRPDGKSQVTVQYNAAGEIERVHTVVLSTQHDPDVEQQEIHDALLEHAIRPVVPEQFLDEDTIIHVNPTGRFVIGGPQGDCGLTGRKIIVDTYGGVGHHGGGAFSGKDSTKVDRSASYMARYIAKNLVAAGLATRLEVQLAYAIGVVDPVSVNVDAFGTGTISDRQFEAVVREVFPLNPQGIIDHLELRKPVFRRTAAYGHFGRKGFRWEETDMVEKIKQAAA